MQWKQVVLTIYLCIAVFGQSSFFSAQTIKANAVGTGAIVENIQFDNDMTTAVVRVVNNSAKDITGFDLSVDLNYKNGETKHSEMLVEFLPKMVSLQSQGKDVGPGEGALHPGNAEEVTVNLVPPSAKNQLASARIQVDMVAYRDLSADGQNERALLRLSNMRKERALADLKAAEIISAAAANTITPDPRGMALKQLRELHDRAMKSGDSGSFAIEIENIIQDLERDQRIDLKSYARERNKDAVLHSQHQRIGGVQ
jgi:hypothetical protein